jgi:signal peptidase II
MPNTLADAMPPAAENSAVTPVATTQQASLPRRIWILLVVALIAIVSDQITKRLIEANIGLYDNVIITPWLSPYLTFTHTQNTGAAFSLLPEGGAIFFVIGIVVCSLILYYAPRLPVSDWISRIALGMQLGGAIGNLIDRFRQGHVTDFIHFQIPEIGFDFPVFNVADSCIVVGVIILITLNVLRKEPVE